MNTQLMMLMFLGLIVIVGMWQSRRMKTMVLVDYTSSSNQGYEKLVREKDGWVVFEGKKHPLLPKYGIEVQYEKGMSSFFPTKIRKYYYKWNSILPIDQTTGEPAIVTPEFMNKLNQGQALGNYAGSQNMALSGGKGGKQGMFEKMMPILMIVMAVAVGYLVYTHMQDAKNSATTQKAIIDIYNTFNHIGTPVIPAGK